MKTDYKGFRENSTTFECDSAVKKGSLVKMVGNGEVGVCDDGDNFIGIVLNVSEDICCVQLAGYIEVANTGNVSVGYQKLSATTSTSVKDNKTNGREYLILKSENSILGFIL